MIKNRERQLTLVEVYAPEEGHSEKCKNYMIHYKIHNTM